MPLANFFDKAALGVSQIIRQFDLAELEKHLEGQNIGIVFESQIANSFEGKVALELIVNLFARLYPSITIGCNDAKNEVFSERLIAIARSINPNIQIGVDCELVTSAVVVGDSSLSIHVPTVYIGSEGWIARVSTERSVGIGNTQNPFGAAAAACFGAANIFRIVFAQFLPDSSLDTDFSLSLVDYKRNDQYSTNPAFQRIELGEAHLIGLGAIGNGAIWVLSRIPELQGILHLIDSEQVELSNLQRYVLTDQSSVDQIKVDLAAKALSGTNLQVCGHSQRWGEYLRERNNWYLDFVAVAVDSAKDRIAVQASLPRYIINAWTQQQNLGVSRHQFLGKDACLACLYLPSGQAKSEDQLVAEAIGMPQVAKELRKLLYTNEPIGHEWIAKIGEALGVPIEPLLPFADKSLRNFYSEGICGGMILKLTEGRNTIKEPSALVPMAFQSALAGVMLAAEMALFSYQNQHKETQTTIDLLRSLGTHLSFRYPKASSNSCICQDETYISTYKAKYESKK